MSGKMFQSHSSLYEIKLGRVRIRMSDWSLVLYFILVVLLLSSRYTFAEEYSLESSEIEKKPYHLGGYAELRPALNGLDRNSALYKLNFYNHDKGRTTYEYNGELQLEGSLEYGISILYLRTNTDYKNTYLAQTTQLIVQESYLSLKPSSYLQTYVGKKTPGWGKGYAWNPVAFLDRPKDPNDPELSREGYIMLSADFTKSFKGPLKTFSFTPVLLPEYGSVNNDFGTTHHVNVAGKFYFLFYDTDIDLIFLSGGSKTARYGFDFSRNITTNLEVHGEFAWINNFTSQFIDRSGNTHQNTYGAKNFLLGLRYLTEQDTTSILEYFHNESGFTPYQMRDYFSFINTGYNTFLSTGNSALLSKASMITTGNYGKMSPMQDYLYLRISQKEPFDILYFTPAITLIANLNDDSFSITPELLYTRYTNFEFRLRGGYITGARNTEFGEKQNDYRVELRVRYYF
jgi:hypothetical protein